MNYIEMTGRPGMVYRTNDDVTPLLPYAAYATGHMEYINADTVGLQRFHQHIANGEYSNATLPEIVDQSGINVHFQYIFVELGGVLYRVQNQTLPKELYDAASFVAVRPNFPFNADKVAISVEPTVLKAIDSSRYDYLLRQTSKLKYTTTTVTKLLEPFRRLYNVIEDDRVTEQYIMLRGQVYRVSDYQYISSRVNDAADYYHRLYPNGVVNKDNVHSNIINRAVDAICTGEYMVVSMWQLQAMLDGYAMLDSEVPANYVLIGDKLYYYWDYLPSSVRNSADIIIERTITGYSYTQYNTNLNREALRDECIKRIEGKDFIVVPTVRLEDTTVHAIGGVATYTGWNSLNISWSDLESVAKVHPFYKHIKRAGGKCSYFDVVQDVHKAVVALHNQMLSTAGEVVLGKPVSLTYGTVCVTIQVSSVNTPNLNGCKYLLAYSIN